MLDVNYARFVSSRRLGSARLEEIARSRSADGSDLKEEIARAENEIGSICTPADPPSPDLTSYVSTISAMSIGVIAIVRFSSGKLLRSVRDSSKMRFRESKLTKTKKLHPNYLHSSSPLLERRDRSHTSIDNEPVEECLKNKFNAGNRDLKEEAPFGRDAADE